MCRLDDADVMAELTCNRILPLMVDDDNDQLAAAAAALVYAVDRRARIATVDVVRDCARYIA